MAQLYADENFPVPVAEELRRLGHDMLTSLQAGKAGQAIPDEDVLAFVVAEQRALLTINRKHFKRLHRKNSNHTGIIVCTFDPDFVGQAARIHAVLCASPELNGQLFRINRPQ